MQRSAWIFSIVFLAALGLILLFLRPRPAIDSAQIDVQMVQTYAVPVDRAESIRDALRTVLLATRENGQPLGHASLPVPGKLVVSAPASMQGSIRRAVEALSEGASIVPVEPRSVAVELWVVGTSDDATHDDPALAPASAALEQARATFGLGRFGLIDRAMVVASADGVPVQIETATLRSELQINAVGASGVRASIDLRLLPRDDRVPSEQGFRSAAAPASFRSTLSLEDARWQVIGLMQDDSRNAPARLLLMRQTPVPSSEAP